MTDSTNTEAKATPKSKKWVPCTCYVRTGNSEITIGCGASTRARFAPGHDAKTKSTLQALYREGVTDVKVIGGGDSFNTTVERLFADLGWEQFMTLKKTKAKKAIEPSIEEEKGLGDLVTSVTVPNNKARTRTRTKAAS